MEQGGKIVEMMWHRRPRLCDRALAFGAQACHAVYTWRRKLATSAVVVLAALIGYHAIFGPNGAVVYQKKKVEYRELQKQVQQLQTENDKLSQDIRALKTDPKAIEREAREQLRYAKPGEVVYLLPSVPAKDAANVDARK